DEPRGIDSEPAEPAADDQRRAVAQRLAQDRPVDRADSPAKANERQRRDHGDELRDRVAGNGRFRPTAEGLDEQEADQKTQRRPRNLLDRIDANLVTSPRAFSKVEVI